MKEVPCDVLFSRDVLSSHPRGVSHNRVQTSTKISDFLSSTHLHQAWRGFKRSQTARRAVEYANYRSEEIQEVGTRSGSRT
jgi:hypothetical protein